MRVNSEFLVKPSFFLVAFLFVLLVFSGSSYENQAVKISGFGLSTQQNEGAGVSFLRKNPSLLIMPQEDK